MRVLVTGGAGFIGSHLVEGLVAADHSVEVIDDLSSGFRDNVPDGVPLHELDIRDDAVSDVFASFKPEVLCHQAAQMDVRRSVADPAFDAGINVVGTLKLLEQCRAHEVTRILFASTGGAIYGEQDTFPAAEDHPLRPVSPYGVSKLAVEKYLYFYQVEYGFVPTMLRYGNVYGPRQNPHGEAGVVAIFAEKYLQGDAPFIYGDGDQTRDFVHVADVVSANLFALDKELRGTYNVGTGIETSVNQIATELGKVLAPDIKAVHMPAKPGEQRRSCIDASRLTGQGWRREFDVEAGFAHTAHWFAARASA